MNDANVAVYTVDSAGVRSIQGFRAEQPTGRSLPRHISGRVGGDTDIVRAISEGTGGRSFMGSNHLSKSVSNAVADSQSFYRLAYRPSHERWDGRFVPIQVKTKRKGIELRARAGYYARSLEPLAISECDRLLQDAIHSPLDAVEIELSVRLLRTSPIEGEETELLISADPGAVSLGEEAGFFRGTFDVRIAQQTGAGETLEDFTDEVSLTADAARRTREEGFAYRRNVRIQAAATVLKVAFCDRATGRLGSLAAPLAATSPR